MSHQKEKEISTSWADETDDFEEPLSKPTTKEGNAWAKGNPWGTAPPKADEIKDANLNDFPEPKGFSERETRKEEKGHYEREGGRPYGNGVYGRKDTNYQRDRNDYPSRDNYKREDRSFNREERPRERDYPKDDQGKYSREERNYPQRNDRFFRDQPPRRDENDRRGARQERQRDPVPLPTEPPFTAFIGNLSFDIREEDLLEFFGTDDCKVLNVRLLSSRDTHKPKGFGYVEFEDLESLKRAVARNGEPLLDRPLKIDIAEAKPEERGGSSSWGNRSGRPPKSFGSSYPSAAPFLRGESGRDESRERPKLDLKPRSESSPKETNAPDTSYQSAKSNPFGSAKPRDENFYLKKIEEDRKKRGEDDKPEASSESSVGEIKQISKEKPSEPQKVSAKETSSNHENRDNRQRRDSGQKRDDKLRNKPETGKPFERGSKSQTRGGFRKEEKNFGKSEKTRKEERVRPDKQVILESKQVDVTSANLFSALNEEEE